MREAGKRLSPRPVIATASSCGGAGTLTSLWGSCRVNRALVKAAVLSGRVATCGESRLSEWKALPRDSNDQIRIDPLLGERPREQDAGKAR